MHLSRLLGRPLATPEPYGPVSVSEDVRRHLLEEAVELYWNEMAWEQIAGEDPDGAGLEMVFPGFMTFVRALLLDETLPEATAPAQPRPDVVEDLLRFLSGRLVDLEEELAAGADGDDERLRGELGMTSGLLDVVLYRYHGLSPADVARVQAAQVAH